MARLVAFAVPSLEDGDSAIAELAVVEDVEDAVLVYKNDMGRVKIRQTTDISHGHGAGRGALLGTAVGIFAAPMLARGDEGTTGELLAALGDHGVDHRLMTLAREELEAGHGAVFVLAPDARAEEIVTKIRRLSRLRQYHGLIEVGDFPAEAQQLVKLHITEQAAA